MPKNESAFERLTWDDLTAWAGPTILSRGKSYKSQVRDLCLTADGGALAWVDGTRAYATMVKEDPSGELSAICSCPYAGIPCKHGIAVVLVYLDALKSKKDLPKVGAGDRRIELIRKVARVGVSDLGLPADEDEESDWDSEDFGDASGTDEAKPPRSAASRTRKGKRGDLVRKRLESMSRDQLVELALGLIQQYPEIGKKIEEEEELKGGRVTGIVGSIRAEIEALASEPAWREHWSGEGYIPDYSGVRVRLESLLKSGYADEVVDLGNDLWRLGNEQVGSSHDEGETSCQIAECMKVVLQAVTTSSLSPRDRILWIIDTNLSDEYDILGRFEDSLDQLDDDSAWSEVADTSLSRLNKMPTRNIKTDYSLVFEREGIMHWAIEALEKSGRDGDILPVLEREAPITQCYDDLVEHLLSAGLRAEAKVAAVDGFRKTIHGSSGVAWRLEAKLCRMAEEDEDLALAAAYRALEFFHSPSPESYKTIKKAAKAAKQWPGVREGVMTFLETGSPPDFQKSGSKTKGPSKGKTTWPLPPTDVSTEISETAAKTAYNHFPATDTLVRISIHENDTEGILRWYGLVKEVMKMDLFFGHSIHEEVAEALKKSHPDLSLNIWKNFAEAQIKLVKPAAYQVAAIYLRKMQDVYRRTQRLTEWTALINSIRVQHKPKRSLMQVLDSLEGKRIIDT